MLLTELHFQRIQSNLLYTSSTYMAWDIHFILDFIWRPRHNYVHFVNNTHIFFLKILIPLFLVEIVTNINRFKFSYTISMIYQYLKIKWTLLLSPFWKWSVI